MSESSKPDPWIELLRLIKQADADGWFDSPENAIQEDFVEQLRAAIAAAALPDLLAAAKRTLDAHLNRNADGKPDYTERSYALMDLEAAIAAAEGE